MRSPPRGEVWLVDLGMAAKVRPCLVLSVPVTDADRALVTLVPHTTSVRGSRFEVSTNRRFLGHGAFDMQNLITIPLVKLIPKTRQTGRKRLAAVGDSSPIMAWSIGLTPKSK